MPFVIGKLNSLFLDQMMQNVFDVKNATLRPSINLVRYG